MNDSETTNGGTTNVERQKSDRGPRYYTKGVSPMKKKLAELAKRSVAKKRCSQGERP